DVYGVGAVLYTAATGVPPFREETPQQTLIAVMSREPVRPRTINPAISEQLELIIQRALAKQPEQRYPSMSALRLALSELEQRSGARFRARQAGASGVSVRWRFMALAASAVLLGVAALSSALLGLLALRGGELASIPCDPLLIALAAGAAFGLCMLALSSFWRRTWRDTAKVADWLPRLRAPLLTVLALYGLGSLGVRLGDDVLARVPLGDALERAPRLAWPGWSIGLAVLALAGGLGVALHEGWWRPLPPRQRWAYGLGLSSALALLALALLRFGSLPDEIGALSLRARADRTESTTHELSPPPSLQPAAAFTSEQPLQPAPESAPKPAIALDAGTNGDAALGAPDAEPSVERPQATHEPAGSKDAHGATNPEPVRAVPVGTEVVARTGHPSAAPAALPLIEPPAPVSSGALTAASAALHELTGAEAIKATALRQAADPRTLVNAVDSVERLLALSPGHAGDADVQRILRQAANSFGEASHSAFRVMSELMGSRGPDMIYD
ncbi:MAG TPA: hypothetical protein VG963_22150, partial [Polyangiaceae bacterium]|nr:hypothetical protein [Polyangiaceae bacterium]